MDAREWLSAYADRLGVAPPTEEETDALLALAGVAAHASERIAAPLSCWLVAGAGIAPTQALTLARQLADDAGERPDDADTAPTAE